MKTTQDSGKLRLDGYYYSEDDSNLKTYYFLYGDGIIKYHASSRVEREEWER